MSRAFFSINKYIAILALYIVVFASMNFDSFVLLFSAMLVVVTLNISLSQICFAYEVNLPAGELRSVCKYCGEKFFASAIWLGTAAALSTIYLSYQLFFAAELKLDLLKYLIALLVFINFSAAMQQLNLALTSAEKLLFKKS